MTAEELKVTLENLQEKILGWPDNVATGDPDIVFKNLESELRQILGILPSLSEQDRTSIEPIIQKFKDAVSERHHTTEQQLNVLKGEMAHNEQRQKAMRAYGERS